MKLIRKRRSHRCNVVTYVLGPTPLVCDMESGHELDGTDHHDQVRDKKWPSEKKS